MNNYLKIALRLTIICSSAVLLLGIVNALTEKKIKSNQMAVESAANKFLMPGCTFSEKKLFDGLDESQLYYYEAKLKKQLAGYIVSTTGNGYGGEMKILVATDKNFKVLNMKLLSNSETPGIGSKAKDDAYMKKFIGTNTNSKPFPKAKHMLSPDDAEAISGATITFNGITEAVDRALKIMKENLKG